MYIDMLPALENFVNYGTANLVQNRNYLNAIVDMVRTIFKDDKVGGVDRICGCKLAEIIMLNMRGHVDEYIPEFISLAMAVLTNDELKVKSLRIHLMEVVIRGDELGFCGSSWYVQFIVFFPLDPLSLN